MSPLGKFTLAVLGLRLAGANGFFLGLWLGHILIDNSKVIHKIESAMAQLDDNIRLMLPYNASRYYNRIEGNFWGKIWGAVLGSVLFGFYGFLLLFIVGHFVFDTPRSSHARAFRAKFDELTSDLVDTRHLMTTSEFARLVAVAQVTPGPVGINTATYVGFTQHGVLGALVGTAGLITPALALVLLAMHFIARWKQSLLVEGGLSGLRPAAYGLLLVAVLVFAEISVFTAELPVEYVRGLLQGTPVEWNFYVRPLPLAIAATVAVVQIRTKFPFIWLIVISAVIGALYGLL